MHCCTCKARHLNEPARFLHIQRKPRPRVVKKGLAVRLPTKQLLSMSWDPQGERLSCDNQTARERHQKGSRCLKSGCARQSVSRKLPELRGVGDLSGCNQCGLLLIISFHQQSLHKTRDAHPQVDPKFVPHKKSNHPRHGNLEALTDLSERFRLAVEREARFASIGRTGWPYLKN